MYYLDLSNDRLTIFTVEKKEKREREGMVEIHNAVDVRGFKYDIVCVLKKKAGKQ